ncbi:hypothetical protein HMPREF9318_00210 [Streptococcus urinalis FB127-CNA-2]|uniref:UPF0342 protein STRUR_0950 n=1 Tax=Streptococcus urinalis 2285-97 TaxID=764291 RepID=G5KFB0_9STRE|nr:YlbF/YmcA family competence regulator [Streptococcus urinalis]EHJ57772.1 hypothetical protein STRUR_0950 [Streptococcus urinalis 2285-97]EKS22012.1 hypothetical protein HMPREF9318_00210 [Streptococcus urinalis FB127-CNA-2]VEF31824.1 Protein of uncharacterised function (DUF964) [Streptococcus urinalis]
MANIYDLANEMEREIRQLPEYKAVEESKKAIYADNEAKTLWTEFLKIQEKVQGTMQSGQMPSQEQQEEMTALGQKIEANTILKEYFDQQQRLSLYISDIEKIIYSPLQDLTK